jgi:hypothetical protein
MIENLRSQENVIVSVKTVSPELAGIWLSKNTRNRNYKRSNLSFIKNMMQRDLFFSLNGESIIIADDGTLLNGQHRLKSMLDLNKTYEFVVVEGVDKNAFTTIDIGVKRSNGDMFEVEKIKNGRNASAAVSFYLKMSRGNFCFKSGTVKNLNITADELLSTYKANEQLFENLLSHAFKFYEKMRVFPLSHIAGMMYYTILHSEFGDNALSDFWMPLFTGNNISSQVSILRNRLIEDMGKMQKERENYKQICWTIQVYNAHFTGKDVKFLRYNSDNEFPKFL